jgi:hypothetical protein
MIVVQPELGLGNRLRVIASFQALAKRTGRPFALSWVPGTGWSDEDLDDLFENNCSRVTSKMFDRLCRDSLRLHRVVRLKSVPNEECEWMAGADFFDLFDQDKHPVISYRGCQRLDYLVPRARFNRLFPSFNAEYARAAGEFRPVPAIQQAIERVTDAFSEHTVGVHIRRGDALASHRSAEYMRSSDTAFHAVMDEELQSNPSTHFFLATDCLATEERFRARYGPALLTNEEKRFVPSRSGKPKANQRDAVIDMFALARTRRILGNHFSSFSKFAALIGDIGWEDVVEKTASRTVAPLLESNSATRAGLLTRLTMLRRQSLK